jgi:hypothetical protein
MRNQPIDRIGGSNGFKPNYGRDRAERQRAARARSEDKQRKKAEKAVLRKAEHEVLKPSVQAFNQEDRHVEGSKKQ